jgi:NAD(P)H-quinone oxidoreductase subunit 5
MPAMNTALLLAGVAAPALLHALAAALARRGDRDAAWRRAEAAALVATVLGVASMAAVLAAGPVHGAGLRLDTAGAVVMALVGFIGWAIVRYSHRQLQGEANERRYLRLLAGTLAAVSLVLAADHLLLLAAAWIATSLTLHRLLRFYADRPAARLAAHKKWLSARAADAALLLAVALLGTAYGTLSLHELLIRADAQGVPPLAQAGLLLLVVAALLKCAQLPLHGWLIQVMEAPTPVSALLHAGVVNLGGLVLIRFSALLAQVPAALVLLAVVATLTVVVATLVTGTRISIKVALAWSTVAQMGFMLLQLALGLPAMALLHLVAHSLVKAHAFLGAGGTVQRQQALRMAPLARPQARRWALAALLMPALVVSAGAAAGALSTPAAWLAGAVLGLALVPLAASGRVTAAAAVALAWFAGHALASAWLGPVAFAVPVALVAAVAVGLALLFALQAVVALHPGSALARRLHPWAYGGFYVDERITQGLLRRWPMPDEAVIPTPATPKPVTGAR